MTIKKQWLIALILPLCTYAQIIDSDFDGVSDTQDECPNTPFLNAVNAQGCTVTILTLPEETIGNDMTLSMGYGFSTNDDVVAREVQHNTTLQFNYYYNQWNYAIHTGYYTHNQHDGILDTVIKVKKRLKLQKNLVLGLGSNIILPTHDYEGNYLDISLNASLHYYPTAALSVFASYSFTRNADDSQLIVKEDDDGQEYESLEAIKNTHKAYAGIGYFFTPQFYANISYHVAQSKFREEHNIEAVSSTLYYKIDAQWFTSLYYKREFNDEDLHDNLIFKIGYHF